MSRSTRFEYRNNIELSGNATADAGKPGQTNSGKPVTNCRMGHNTSKGKKGSFYALEFFGKKKAKRAAKIKKGDAIIIEKGRIRVDEWDPEDGSGKRHTVVITVEKFRVVPKKKKGTKAQSTPEVNATRGAVRLASEKGVNIDDVEGTGPGGRIMQVDVEKHPG